jgi:hypothetical protein
MSTPNVGPTARPQSALVRFQSAILTGGLDSKTKGFLLAALACCVGSYSHGKCYIPEFNNWERGKSKTYHPGNETGLNCWTAVLWWAFQGGALSHEELVGYMNELRAVKAKDPGELNQKQSEIMYSFMRANQVVDITASDQPPAGVTVFFGDSGWHRPLNHVVASLGEGYCVSCQSLSVGVKVAIVNKIAEVNPTMSYEELTVKRRVHISTIKLIAAGGDDTPRIRKTPQPFWELPRVAWT